MERGILHLSRKTGERIVITIPDHPPIYVQVKDKNRTTVTLTVNSPKTVRVDREEVYLARESLDTNEPT